MKSRLRCCVLILTATIIAAAVRLPLLAQRPMHGDEAVHAVKFGDLLQDDFYRYNPHEYHGPTLNYMTLIPAWLSGQSHFENVTEFTLRIMPVFFGIMLVFGLIFLVNGLGCWPAAIAALLTAISPAFVFYSRYYIQEMLLVCFSFGIILCGYRYLQSKKLLWALLAGIFAGLCHATKETCLIVFASMLLALFFTWLKLSRHRGKQQIGELVTPWHVAAAAVVAAMVSMLFFSSFFTNPRGIVDSIAAYTTYFHRAGSNHFHIHPWYYYLKMIIYSKCGGGPLWTEAIIVLLACVGFFAAMKKKIVPGIDAGLLTFVAFYTLIMTAIYSAIPYKTPWCMLGFLHGMILLAGVGAVVLIRLLSNVWARAAVVFLLTVAFLHLGWQCYTANYRYYTEPRNPYVYAHPTKDVVEMANRVKDIAAISADGLNMPVQVVCTGHDYWPFPWYLRTMPNVYWWSSFDNNVRPAPVIIISADKADALAKFIDRPPPVDLYVHLFGRDMQLRPQVELKCYVTKDLKDRYMQNNLTPDGAHRR